VVDSNNEPATTPAYLDDITDDTVEESTNEYIKGCVAEVNISPTAGGGTTDVNYDTSPTNGELDLYRQAEAGRGPEYEAIDAACDRPRLIYVRELQHQYALSDNAEQGDDSITVLDGARLLLNRTYTLWRRNLPGYSTMYSENVTFVGRPAGNPNEVRVQNPLAHDYPAGSSYVTSPLGGISLLADGIFVASGDKTLDKVMWTFAHELLHDVGALGDIGEVNNLMGDYLGTNLRFRELPLRYTPDLKQSQWETVPRSLF
jgi:hypothetical protein